MVPLATIGTTVENIRYETGFALRKGNRFSSYFPDLACTASQDACFAAVLIQPEEKKKLIHQI
jgi:hypothetical protein